MLRRLLAVATTLGVLTITAGIGIAATSRVASAATSSTPIVVGGEGSLDLAPGMALGFEAGIYRFNKAGGLDGRKIDFTGVLDDGLSPTTDLSNARQLVENKHVMVLSPFYSAVASDATGTYLAGAKVPFEIGRAHV